MKKLNKKEWEDLFNKKILRPTLAIAFIPSGIGAIISLVMAIISGVYKYPTFIIIGATVWVLFVSMIGILYGGTDFKLEYGDMPEK